MRWYSQVSINARSFARLHPNNMMHSNNNTLPKHVPVPAMNWTGIIYLYMDTPSSPTSSTDQPGQPSLFRKVIGMALIVLAIGVGFFLIYQFHQVLFILFTSIILGTVLRPLMQKLTNAGLPTGVAIAIMLIGILALLILFGFLLVPMLTEQGTRLSALIPQYYDAVRGWIAHSPNTLIARMSILLPASIGQVTSPGPASDQGMLSMAGRALSYFSSGFTTVFVAFSMTLLTYYWMIESPKIIQSMLFFLQPDKRLRAQNLITEIETKVRQYLVGQSILCLSIGLLATTAYLIIGLPNAIVLGLLAGIFEAIPMVGPVLGAITAGVVALSLSPIKLLWVVIATLVMQQLENNLLVPRVMRKVVGINPFVSLLSIATFSALYGIGGAVMAIPMAAILQLLLDSFVFKREPEASTLSTGRDQLGLLRYETQDFAMGLRNQARESKEGTKDSVTQVDEVMDQMEHMADDLDQLLAEKALEEGR